VAGINKEWVDHWKRVGPELDKVRIRELRSFNHEERWPMIDALLQMGIDRAVPRITSGLVELQRRLARFKR